MHAAELANPSYSRFSTYAGWWIKQKIQRFLYLSDEIHIPLYLQQVIFGMKPVLDQFRREGRLLDHKGILSALNDRGYFKKDEPLKSRLKLVRKAADAYNISVKRGDSAEFFAHSEDEGSKRREEEEHLRKLVFESRVLDPREQSVISMRFGFRGNGTATLDEVAEEIGISRERVRQIQSEALEKLALAVA